MMKKIILLATVAVCNILVTGCGPKDRAQHQEAPVYASMKIEPVNIVVSDAFPASIEGQQDIAIYPQISGTISKVCVKEGQKVKKGESLFIIDQVPFKAALQMAVANVESAKAGVATAQLLYDSRVKLYEENVISEFDMLTSKNQLLTAKAGLAQAEAALVNAENNFTYTKVLSPADGVVGTLPFRAGALVSPSQPKPLTTVSDNAKMYVYYSLSETQLLELTAEHGSMKEAISSLPKVQLELANGKIYQYDGKIETISGVIDPSTASVSVRAVFPNDGGILHSGASGRVIIPSAHENVVVIPVSATFELQDIVFVYRVEQDRAVAVKLSVELSDNGKEYIVKSGLAAGDIIITEGVGLIRDGQQVNIK